MTEFLTFKKVIDKNKIQKHIEDLASKLNNVLQSKEVVVFYIEKGGKPFFEAIQKLFKFKYESESIIVKSYQMDKSGELRWIKKPSLNIRGKVCLLIDDILDTGRTLSKVKNYILNLGAKECLVCVAIDKHERRVVSINADYKLFDVEKGFLVGFGMDYNDQYRDLEDIYEIDTQR